MKLIRLELLNFRQHLDSAIDFTDGVTGVIGPNGAGKTTILEGIAWALYGSPALRGNNDSVRSKAAPGGSKAKVALSFEIGGARYKVSRILDGSGSGSATLEVDGRVLNSGTRDVNAAVAQLLGMDYQAFFTSFFTAQKELEFMAAMDGRTRAAAISRMLGYDRLTKARDQANSDRLGISKAVDALEQQIGDPDEIKQRKKDAQAVLLHAKKLFGEAESETKSAQDLLGKLKPLKEVSDQKSKRRDELSRRLELDRADIARAEQRLTALKTEIDALNTKHAEFDALKTKLSSFREQADELKHLTELSHFEGDRQRLSGQISALENDMKALRAREKSFLNSKDNQIRTQAGLQAAESLLSETDSKLRACREERIGRAHSLDAQIAGLELQSRQVLTKRKQIESAGADGKCPTCERPLSDELSTVLANFDLQINDVTGQIDSLRAQKTALEQDKSLLNELEKTCASLNTQTEQLRKEKSNADARVAEFESTRKQIDEKSGQLKALTDELAKLPGGFDEKRFHELQQLRENLQPERERAAALKGEIDRLPKLAEELSVLDEQTKARNLEITACESTLTELAFSEQEHEQLARDFESASVRLNNALLELEKQRGEVKTAGAILSQIEQEEASHKARIDDLNAKRAERLYLDTLAKAFDALRAELNTRIRPELEDAAGELLSEMTDGRYTTLNIDDAYKAVIVDDGEEKPVISGGEDDIVNLALRLAISQMIADRAGQSFSLLVLDEVFGSLDDTRRDNVVSLLQNLKNRFEQIILITHVESIHDAVDNCVWIEFDEKTKTSRLADRSSELNSIPVGVIP